MGYYCEKEDCKCPHYYNHVCYIEKIPVKEAKEFECDCKPEIKETDCNKLHYTSRVSYYSGKRNYSDDGYYRNNYV